eukprot:scaffold549_cov385-Prasinococcus_capsulatus_cf.AAC.50
MDGPRSLLCTRWSCAYECMVALTEPASIHLATLLTVNEVSYRAPEEWPGLLRALTITHNMPFKVFCAQTR